jgi:hypothetical protein
VNKALCDATRRLRALAEFTHAQSMPEMPAILLDEEEGERPLRLLHDEAGSVLAPDRPKIRPGIADLPGTSTAVPVTPRTSLGTPSATPAGSASPRLPSTPSLGGEGRAPVVVPGLGPVHPGHVGAAVGLVNGLVPRASGARTPGLVRSPDMRG